MSWSFVNAASNSFSGAASFSISKPTGVVDNDILILVVNEYSSAGSGVSLPSGWTQLSAGQKGAASTNHWYLVAYKIASGESSSYTINLASTSSWGQGLIYALRESGGAPTVITANFSVTNGSTYVTSMPSATSTIATTSDATVYIYTGINSAASGTETLTVDAGLSNLQQVTGSADGGIAGVAWGVNVSSPAAATSTTAVDYVDCFIDIQPAGSSSPVAASLPGRWPDQDLAPNFCRNSWLAPSSNAFKLLGDKTPSVYSGPAIVQMTGFEYGIPYGLRTGIGGKTQLDYSDGTEGTGIVVQNTNTRPGSSYAMRFVVTTSAQADAYWTSSGGSPGNSLPVSSVLVGRFWWCPETTTGSDVPAIAHINSSAGGNSYFEYWQSTGQLSLVLGSGTTVKSANGSVTVGQWHAIDFCIDMSSGTWTGDWRLNGVTQTRAVQTASSDHITEFRFGCTSLFNITMSYDDIALSQTVVDYPLPDMNIVSLPVNGSGTHSISADFQQTTNNGSSFSAVSSPETTVDETPPTMGSSADAVAQTTASASAYLEFTHAQTTSTTIYAVKHILAGFETGSTVNLAAVLLDGSSSGNTLGTPASPVNPSFVATTSTAIGWANKVYSSPPSGLTWTPALVNALRTRVGYSTTITGNPGINAAYLEVAQAPVSTIDCGTVAGVPSSERIGAATQSATIDCGTVKGERSLQNTGSAAISSTVDCGVASGLPSAEITGAVTAIFTFDCGALIGVPSSEAIGTVAISSTVDCGTVAGVPSSERIGAATQSATIDCGTVKGERSLQNTGSAAISSTVDCGTVAGLPSSEVIGAATLSSTIDCGTVAGLPSSEVIGAATQSATIDCGITPGVRSLQGIGAAAISSTVDCGVVSGALGAGQCGAVSFSSVVVESPVGLLSPAGTGGATLAAVIDLGLVAGVVSAWSIGAATVGFPPALDLGSLAGLPSAGAIGKARVGTTLFVDQDFTMTVLTHSVDGISNVHTTDADVLNCGQG